VFGGGPGGFDHHDGPRSFGRGPGELAAAAAKAIGKSWNDVKAAIRSAAKTRLEKAVADGQITRAEAHAKLEHLGEHLEAGELGGGGPGWGRHRGFGRGPGDDERAPASFSVS
jgi:hypothetical protein